MKQDIINSFDNIAKFYEETSFLLKDFSEAITNHQFISISGNSIGTTYVSKAINSPRYWLTRYAALFFKPNNQEDNSPLLSVTVGFYDLEPKAVEPYVILGIVKGMDHPERKKGWQYWWLFSPFFNDEKAFDYSIVKNGKEQKISIPSMDGKITNFKCHYSDESYHWPKEGSLFVLPLLSVKDNNQIKILSQKVVDLWKSKFGD
jgi:hypothetical protein